jgi:hypothetical protein
VNTTRIRSHPNVITSNDHYDPGDGEGVVGDHRVHPGGVVDGDLTAVKGDPAGEQQDAFSEEAGV